MELWRGEASCCWFWGEGVGASAWGPDLPKQHTGTLFDQQMLSAGRLSAGPSAAPLKTALISNSWFIDLHWGSLIRSMKWCLQVCSALERTREMIRSRLWHMHRRPQTLFSPRSQHIKSAPLKTASDPLTPRPHPDLLSLRHGLFIAILTLIITDSLLLLLQSLDDQQAWTFGTSVWPFREYKKV